MQYRRRNRSRRRRIHNRYHTSFVYSSQPRTNRTRVVKYTPNPSTSKTFLRRGRYPTRTRSGTGSNLRRGSYPGKSPWKHGQEFWETGRTIMKHPIVKADSTLWALKNTNKYLFDYNSPFSRWARNEILNVYTRYNSNSPRGEL